MTDPLRNITFTASMLASTALETPAPPPPTRYPAWKIARNCAVVLGAVALGAGAIYWVGTANDRRDHATRALRHSEAENGRAS